MPANLLLLLFILFAAHFICDYPLQGDTTAREKNRHSTTELQKHVPWCYWMFAHSIMHGLAVTLCFYYFSSANLWVVLFLGLLETVMHFVIDYVKCENHIDIFLDQMFHLLLKVIYWTVFILGMSNL